jgi:hypothetical protein
MKNIRMKNTDVSRLTYEQKDEYAVTQGKEDLS